MAITRSGQWIRMTAAADVVTGKLQLQGVYILGASVNLTDAAGNVILIRGAGTDGEYISFPCKLELDGASFTGTGAVTLFLS